MLGSLKERIRALQALLKCYADPSGILERRNKTGGKEFRLGASFKERPKTELPHPWGRQFEVWLTKLKKSLMILKSGDHVMARHDHCRNGFRRFRLKRSGNS